MNVFIGIDDTDNLETRGTGYHARMLGHSLVEAGLFEMRSVTRHQLFIDRRIPFTAHNNSACLAGVCTGNISDLIDHAMDFIKRESAFDSDAGLCVAMADEIIPAIIKFGNRAKREIVTINDAYRLIYNTFIYLEGFLNSRIGLIGSLAAVGLRAGGNDGRLIWSRNLRETTGDFRISEFLGLVDVDRVVEKNLIKPDPESIIRITEWCTPVMIGGKITLIAEKNESNQPYSYLSASKDFFKSISG